MVIFFAFVMGQIWINRFKDDAVSESSSSVDLMISECYNAVSAGQGLIKASSKNFYPTLSKFEI